MLTADSMLSGQFVPAQTPVDLVDVMREIDDAVAEASARRLRMVATQQD